MVSRFSDIAKKYKERIALSYLDQEWTYGELDAISDRAAAGLLALGVKKGTKVALWSNELPEAIFCYLGILKTGGIAVMLNTSWTALEVQERLEDSDAEILIYEDGFRSVNFVEGAKNLKLCGLQKKIYIGRGGAESEYDLNRLYADGDAMPRDAVEKAKAAILPEDGDVILFTSGSTSRPKAVLSTHYSRVHCALAQAEMVRADERDVFCIAIPMFHCFSMTGNMLAAWAIGAELALPESRKTDHLFTCVEKRGCTVLCAVPTLYSAMLANKRRDSYDISTLRTGVIGGSLYSETFFRRVCEELHMVLISSLGQTEAVSAVTGAYYEDSLEARATTVGHFLKGTEGAIKDIETKEVLPLYQIGEICYRGFNTMKEYYRQPELTAAVFDGEGYIHTGDLGFLDKDGNVHMTGRLKELIIRGGENIAPGEVESAIMQDDRVAQVKVVGVPDAHYGEEVCAVIIPAEGQEIPPEEIREKVAGLLASYKVPRYVLYSQAFPLKGSGKVDTQAIEQWAAREILG